MRRPERAADPRPRPAAGVVPAGRRKARRVQPEPADATKASRRSRGGRASSRTPARPKAAKTSSSTSTTSTVARLKATGGWVLTLHEIVIDGDDAWVTANKNIARDLSSYGGAYNGALIDSAVQEYNLKTGQAAAQLGRARPHPARRVLRVAADQRLPVGRLPRQLDRAASATARSSSRCATRGRRTSSTSRAAGSSGRSAASTRASSSVRGAAFQWQHDVDAAARRRRSRVFDDHCCRQTGGGTSVPRDGAVARARAGAEPADAHRDAACAQYASERGLRVRIHGRHAAARERRRVRRLGLGTVLLGVRLRGQAAVRRGTARAGPELPRDASSGGSAQPLHAAGRRRSRAATGGTTVYASWNGATQLAAWRVLAGPDAGQPDGRRDARQVGLRDGDRRAGGPPELRAAGARRRRARARDVLVSSRPSRRPARTAYAPRYDRRPDDPQPVNDRRRARGAARRRRAERVRRHVAGDLGDARRVDRAPGGRPRRDLAAAGDAGRVAGRRRSASSAAPATTDRRTCSVIGSHSGAHAACCAAYSTGTGESFLPGAPFAAGEQVTVSAQVTPAAPRTRRARASRSRTRRAVSQTEFPINPGNPHDGAALQLGAVADAVDDRRSRRPRSPAPRPATCSSRPIRARARPGR